MTAAIHPRAFLGLVWRNRPVADVAAVCRGETPASDLLDDAGAEWSVFSRRDDAVNDLLLRSTSADSAVVISLDCLPADADARLRAATADGSGTGLSGCIIEAYDVHCGQSFFSKRSAEYNQHHLHQHQHLDDHQDPHPHDRQHQHQHPHDQHQHQHHQHHHANDHQESMVDTLLEDKLRDRLDRERRLVRKMDLRIIPFVSFLYLLSFLDRANVGNVHDQLQEDLHISEGQYSIAVGIFFVGYVLFEVPSNLMLKKVHPASWIARIMITWGILSACSAAVSTYAGILVVRVLLGVAEAGFFPGIIFYLQFFYTKHELALRIALFYFSSTLAGTVGGILAFFILQMDGVADLAGWRWLFILEGLPSIVFGIYTFFYLPNFPKNMTIVQGKSSWLTEEERLLAIERLENQYQSDEKRPTPSEWGRLQSNTSRGSDEQLAAPAENDAPLKHVKVGHDEEQEDKGGVVFRTMTNPVMISFCLLYLCLAMGLYSISFFLPAIVKTIGFTSLRANLVTAPMYFAAGLTVIAAAFSSDRRQERFVHLLLSCMGTALGFTCLSLCDLYDLGSISAFFPLASATIACMFAFTSIPLCLAWATDRFRRSATEKAVASSTIISFGNIGGFVGPNIFGWLAREARPDGSGKYANAFVALASIFFAGFLLTLTTRLLMHWHDLSLHKIDRALVPGADSDLRSDLSDLQQQPESPGSGGDTQPLIHPHESVDNEDDDDKMRQSSR